MKGFASLHTSRPTTQGEHEVSYEGYKRIAVDLDDGIGAQPVNVFFPVIQSDSDDIVRFIAVGTSEEGDGEVMISVPTLEMDLKKRPERLTEQFWINGGATPAQAKEMVVKYGEIKPHVILCNDQPVTYPENINPIARVAHQLVFAGQLSVNDIHPKLYEAINDALHNAGVPVLKVTRSGTAKIDIKLSQMPSLDQLSGATH